MNSSDSIKYGMLTNNMLVQYRERSDKRLWIKLYMTRILLPNGCYYWCKPHTSHWMEATYLTITPITWEQFVEQHFMELL